MNRYPIAQLIKLWERAAITEAQAIGQLLLYVEDLATRLQALERGQKGARQPEDRPREES